MTTEEVEVKEENKKSYLLGPQDRCDSCQAEALVWVNGVVGDLLFCGHHFYKHEDKLREYAFEIVDEREKLVQNKLIGSAN
jgi:hypothetical protein